jgi:two-component system, NtrC family, nitrogen regulation sensor histidine kinase NtrY
VPLLVFAVLSRIRQRLALAIVVTALIPVLVAIWLAESTVRQTAARFYQPEIETHLERSLGVYEELAHAVKRGMRSEAAAIAERGSLRRAAKSGDAAAVKRELALIFPEHPSLVSLVVKDAEGRALAQHDRGRPLDPKLENALEVERELGDGSDPDAPALISVFATERARFDELSEMNQFVDLYKAVDRRREADQTSYVLAFALLLGITIALAIGVGTLLAQNVAGRVRELSKATQLVAAGDLTIRVPERGHDELAELARAFNAMLAEVADSRSRIEYLQRIAAWQEMARRLAHEIKNPLTPIQLAVQEIHRRCPEGDANFKRLLDSTLEIVEDEVGTLRRLVGEFSDFARLPRAILEPEDLAVFLREQRDRLLGRDEERSDGEIPLDLVRGRAEGAELVFELPGVGEEPLEVLMDRQMLRRVLINLIQNAFQALSEKPGKVRVRLSRDGDFANLDVEDSGPGIPEENRQTVFDPYVTTKHDGTGLGLAIVKKVVIEHGGSVTAQVSELGGALLRVRLPRLGSRASALVHGALESRSEVGVGG